MLYIIVLLYTSVLLYNTIDLKVLCSCVISCYYLSKMGEQAIKSMGVVFHGQSQIGERGGEYIEMGVKFCHNRSLPHPTIKNLRVSSTTVYPVNAFLIELFFLYNFVIKKIHVLLHIIVLGASFNCLPQIFHGLN